MAWGHCAGPGFPRALCKLARDGEARQSSVVSRFRRLLRMDADVHPPAWWADLAALPAVRLRCVLRVEQASALPSAGEIRGAIGHRLMAQADPRALACFFPSNREAAGPGFLGHATPWALHVDDAGRLEIGVFADGVPNLLALHQALMEASRGRIGAHDGLPLQRFEHQPLLVDGEWKPGLPVEAALWPAPTMPQGDVDLVLLSPLRIRRRGAEIRSFELTPRDLLSHLMRRASALLQQSGVALPTWDAKAMLAAIDGLDFPLRELESTGFARYSARQGQAMRLQGLTGRLRLPQELVHAAWPLLWMGQALHVGKTPCLGMGRYRLEGARNSP